MRVCLHVSQLLRTVFSLTIRLTISRNLQLENRCMTSVCSPILNGRLGLKAQVSRTDIDKEYWEVKEIQDFPYSETKLLAASREPAHLLHVPCLPRSPCFGLPCTSGMSMQVVKYRPIKWTCLPATSRYKPAWLESKPHVRTDRQPVCLCLRGFLEIFRKHSLYYNKQKHKEQEATDGHWLLQSHPRIDPF
jgi:hypothetical protein